MSETIKGETMFSAGDVVRLKSGGPLMTVGEIQRFDPPATSAEVRAILPAISIGEPDRKNIAVAWFDGAQIRRATVTVDMLEYAAGDGSVSQIEKSLLASQMEVLSKIDTILIHTVPNTRRLA